MLPSLEGAASDHARVLIIGSHAITRLGLRLLLATDPRYHIVGQLDHGAPVSFFVASQAVDLVVLDLCLPDIHGNHILAELIGRYDMTVVVLVNAVTVAEIEHALKLGARAVLSMSDPEEQILAACDSALIGEFYQSSSMKDKLVSFERAGQRLFPRQMAILHYLAHGAARPEICCRLGVSGPTLSFHIAELMRTFGVLDVRALISRARELAILGPRRSETGNRIM